ncbi:hypothetical protein [Caballeronia sp. AZ10_KS36]|uniref:hypothetical protein n=1 Tax=Caballeronia sp. AZ10_KS36 TaxID=2921757 RepID=UPI002028B684|nr:hypothetical protein [Caballeronia sp. AZ10_KS36]
MKTKTVAAVVTAGDQEVAADFDVSAGRIRITSDGAVVEDIGPPDSWIALSSVAEGSGWGTHPTADDLERFLKRYVAERGESVHARPGEREQRKHRRMRLLGAVQRWLNSQKQDTH